MRPYLLLALLVVGCSGSMEQPVDSSALPSCDFDLTEGGFIQELLDARATPRTQLFDDYTEGSYHVDKLTLLSSLTKIATENSNLLGAVVVGPYGPIWAYQVTLFVQEENGVRANWLVMPHARITFKATKLLTSAEFSAFQNSVLTSSFMSSTLPAVESGADASDLEWEFGMGVRFWSPVAAEAYLADTWFQGDAEVLEAAGSLSDDILEGSLVTYSNDIPEEFGSNFRCEENEGE